MVERLLLVEDESFVARTVQLSLPDLEVVVAESRERAFELLLKYQDWVGVLVDLHLTRLKDFQGLDVLRYLKGTDIPRAVLTGARLEGSVHERFFTEFGVSDVVLKGESGLALNDVRDCVRRMREASLVGAKTRAHAEIWKAWSTIDEKLSGELQRLEALSRQVEKAVGYESSQKLTREDVSALESLRGTLQAQREELLGAVAASETRDEIEEALSKARDVLDIS
jgi:CheY-like chemotaxis protein